MGICDKAWPLLSYHRKNRNEFFSKLSRIELRHALLVLRVQICKPIILARTGISDQLKLDHLRTCFFNGIQ